MNEVTIAAMPTLLASYRRYLLDERMLALTTTGRYLAVMEEFAGFLTHSDDDDATALEAVDKELLTGFLRKRAGASGTRSRATWNNRLAALRSFYGWLYGRELISANPALKVDRLKTRPKESVPLTFDEMADLLRAVEESSPAYRVRNTAIVQVLFHTGLRVAELSSLDVARVDFINCRFLDVRRKGDKHLSLEFNDVVSTALEAHLETRDEFGLHADEDALFLSDRGTRLSVRQVQEIIRMAAEKAGISRKVTPHLLRHSSASELSALGVSLPVIQGLLGHASVTTTERYVHTRSAQRREAVDALASAGPATE